MTTTTTTMRQPARPRVTPRSRAFAFTEILFAVMVLGLGFIMIAAMFPVTIRQTQSTMEEASAAAVAQGAMEYLQNIASEDLFPITNPPQKGKTNPDPLNDAIISDPAEVVSFNHVAYANPQRIPSGNVPKSWNGKPAYYTARGNFVDPKNPRIAWVPLYRRVNGSPFAQVFIIVIQSRNRDQYVTERDRTGLFPDRNYSDLDLPPDVPAGQTGYSTLEPRDVMVAVEYDKDLGKGVVTIEPQFKDLAATGAYLIISRDPNKGIDAPPLETEGQSVGRVYQLGNPVNEATGEWELTPASDMIRTGPDKSKATEVGDDNELPEFFNDPKKATHAYMIGRGYKDPLKSLDGYAGPAQEIGVYTGFIHIPPAAPLQP